MTNEELFADLKQFIEATISQQTADLVTKDDLKAVEGRLEHRMDGLERRMGGLEGRMGGLERRMDTTDEKLDEIMNAVGETVQDHEKRLKRLEQRTA